MMSIKRCIRNKQISPKGGVRRFSNAVVLMGSGVTMRIGITGKHYMMGRKK
jgi:hypothetical protein